jgi:formate dehydrogenase subunit beta
MFTEIKRQCMDLLSQKKVSAIYGLRNLDGNAAPFLFTKAEELDGLSVDRKYPVIFTVRPAKKNIVSAFQEKYPSQRIAVLARGCDERAMFEVAKRGQIQLADIDILGYACDAKQAELCHCPRPSPQNLKFGEKVQGPSNEAFIETIVKMSVEEREAFWVRQFSKCIKCYGCRNSCPVCICKECWMENGDFSPTGWLPPDFPMFHFVHFYHLADSCVECGACVDACPMDIPLNLVRKVLSKKVQEDLRYTAGQDPEEKPPLATREEVKERLERGN